jgi:hypothetical protein
MAGVETRMKSELQSALRIVWLAVTLVTASSAAAPFLLPEPLITSLAPVCESKRRYGRECFLCGSTTAFIAIGRGDWASAQHSSRLAGPLFIAFSANAVIAFAYLTQERRKASRSRARRR